MTLNGSGIRRYLKGIKDKYHNRNELHKKIKIYKICKYKSAKAERKNKFYLYRYDKSRSR